MSEWEGMTGHSILPPCLLRGRKVRNRESLWRVQSQLSRSLWHVSTTSFLSPRARDSTVCTRAQKTATESACRPAGALPKEEPRWVTRLSLFTRRGIPDSRPSPPLKSSNAFKCSFISSQLHMAYETGLTEPKQGCPTASWQQIGCNLRE